MTDQKFSLQRFLSGLLAIAGALALGQSILSGDSLATWNDIILAIMTGWGLFLFGFYAVTGRFPGRHLRKADSALRGSSRDGA